MTLSDAGNLILDQMDLDDFPMREECKAWIDEFYDMPDHSSGWFPPYDSEKSLDLGVFNDGVQIAVWFARQADATIHFRSTRLYCPVVGLGKYCYPEGYEKRMKAIERREDAAKKKAEKKIGASV